MTYEYPYSRILYNSPKKLYGGSIKNMVWTSEKQNCRVGDAAVVRFSDTIK